MSEANPTRLEELILARVSVRTKQAPTRADVSKALHAMTARRFTKAEWDRAFEGALASLEAGGLLEWVASPSRAAARSDSRGRAPRRGPARPTRLALTPGGIERLRSAFQLRAAPAARTWSEFRKTYLPRVLFPEAARSNAKLKPAAAVLARRLEVSLEDASTTARVVDAWLARSLGLPHAKKLELNDVRAALLARELGLPRRGSLKDVAGLAAAALAGATKSADDAILDGLALGWLTEPAGAPAALPAGAGRAQPAAAAPPSRDAQLERVVTGALRAASGPAARPFGPNKVFIGSVWRALATEPEMAALGEAEFKRLLVEAHRRGLLVLSRADLVAAMDPEELTASETIHQNATYHFIQREASA